MMSNTCQPQFLFNTYNLILIYNLRNLSGQLLICYKKYIYIYVNHLFIDLMSFSQSLKYMYVPLFSFTPMLLEEISCGVFGQIERRLT